MPLLAQPVIHVPPGGASLAMESWRRFPEVFFADVLGADPWGAQLEILRSVRDNYRTAVRSSNATGKDWLAARAAIWWLMAHDEAIVVTTGPSFHQIRNIVWREIHAAWASARYSLSPEPPNMTEWSLGPKRFALGLSTNEKERFSGLHAANILIIVTETSGMPDDILDAIDTLTAGGEARTLYISNPTRISGTFYHAFHGMRELYSCFRIPAWETPNFVETGITRSDIIDGSWKEKLYDRPVPRPYLITPRWVAEKLVKWGLDSQLWKVYVEAEFASSDDSHLFPLEALEDAIDNEDYEKTGTRSLGVDVARKGENRTVFTLLDGLKIVEQREYPGGPTTETADRAKRYIKTFGGDLYVGVDDSGIGGGVVDILQTDGHDVLPFIASGRPHDPERFANFGSEAYWHLREAFLSKRVCIPGDLATRERLVTQLSKITYEQQIRTDKILVHKRGGSGRNRFEDRMEQESPDLSDSLAIAVSAGEGESGANYFMF